MDQLCPKILVPYISFSTEGQKDRLKIFLFILTLVVKITTSDLDIKRIKLVDISIFTYCQACANFLH